MCPTGSSRGPQGATGEARAAQSHALAVVALPGHHGAQRESEIVESARLRRTDDSL